MATVAGFEPAAHIYRIRPVDAFQAVRRGTCWYIGSTRRSQFCVQRGGSFVSTVSGVAVRTSDSKATSRELANVREELSRLRSEAGHAIHSTSQQQEADRHQVQSRVDATVAQFEAIGAETSARAHHAQQSSAEAMHQAQQAASIGRQAGSVASEAHSHGTEALRRTEVLMKKQTEEMDEMKQQMQSMRKMQEESQDLVKQLHKLLVKTQEQLKQSHENVVSMHNQLQTEKGKVVAMEKQLQEESDRTTHLTNAVQKVQVDAAAQAELMTAQAASGSNTAGPNLEVYRLVEQQRELLTSYQELARIQAQKQASTSGSSSGHRLQIQMKPNEPPTFTGRKDQDVDIWLHQVEDYFALTKPNDEDGVAYLVLKLSHFARDWWEAEVKAHRRAQPATIEEMKMLLREAFSSPLRERHARAEIRNLRQKPGEDYREYASRFKSLLARLPAGSYSDAIAMDNWIFGLNPPYRERVMALKPKTLQEAISIMGELDIAHQFCRRDGRGQTAQTQGCCVQRSWLGFKDMGVVSLNKTFFCCSLLARCLCRAKLGPSPKSGRPYASVASRPDRLRRKGRAERGLMGLIGLMGTL